MINDRESDFLRCLQDAESELEELPTSQKRVWRKLGAHILRIHDQTDDMERALEDLNKSSQDISSAIAQFREAVFHPRTGIIVTQQRQSDRMRWTVVILATIASVLTFALGMASGVLNLWRG